MARISKTEAEVCQMITETGNAKFLGERQENKKMGDRI